MDIVRPDISDYFNPIRKRAFFVFIGLIILFFVLLGLSTKNPSDKKTSSMAPTKTLVTPTASTNTPIETYVSQLADLNIASSDKKGLNMNYIDVLIYDSENITPVGVSEVKSNMQEALTIFKKIQSELNHTQAPQEMIDVQSHYITGTNLLIKAGNILLTGINNNDNNEIKSARPSFHQAKEEVGKANQLFFAIEERHNGSFATITHNLSGITIKNNFDVPLIACGYYMEASASNWENAWDYHEDENTNINIASHKTMFIQWHNITDEYNQPTFNYPPTQPYDVKLDCQVNEMQKSISQKME